jgi:COP9 signalosome complex subunit 7
MKSLSLESHAQLESLVTQAIYSSLIAARLSPTSSPAIVRVTSVAPLRDVRPEAVNGMISILAEWQDRCNNVINGIEAEIQTIRADAQKKQLRERDQASFVQKLLDGDNDGGEGGGAGESGNQSNTKRFLRSMMEGSFGGGGGGGRRGQSGGGFSTGNKREYNATRDGLPLYALGDKGMEPYSMEIDEGFSGDPARHSKRILGMGTR